MPLTIGGGISTIKDIRNLLNAGADKVSINSSAIMSPTLSEAANNFGSQCIVVAIDAKQQMILNWKVDLECSLMVEQKELN